MTDQEINIAIAEACGYVPPQPGIGIPLYASDLNAMHEAENILLDDAVQRFETYLNVAIAQGCRVCDWSLYPGDKLWHATARQRAEAFLRTLGKWKD